MQIPFEKGGDQTPGLEDGDKKVVEWRGRGTKRGGGQLSPKHSRRFKEESKKM